MLHIIKMDQPKCKICKKKLRNSKYELDYIGKVCCYCFRISREKYCQLVEQISEQNLEYINLEINIMNRYKKWN
jgi:hypothetical protein